MINNTEFGRTETNMIRCKNGKSNAETWGIS